jgi:hypothetical protein
MRISPVAVTIGLCMLAVASHNAFAQPAAERGYVAIKGGLNIERAEDDVHGTTGGGGAVAGFTFAEPWAIEAEFWLPGAIRTSPEDGRHRDTLFSVAFRRAFGREQFRPHFLVGASVGWTEDEFTTCVANRPTPLSPVPQPMLVSCDEPDVVERHQERFVSTQLLPLIGAGVEIKLTDRVRVIPDVRVQVWITSVIVRPAIAIGIGF